MTTGQNAGIGNGTVNGGIGLTTSQMQNPANYATTYAGWDFANVWSAPSAGYYPQLYGVNYVLRVDPANALRAYGDANPAFTYTSYGLHTGDTSAILAGLSLSTAATTTSNVGSYAITAGGSVISTAGQAYRLIQTPAALTVTPRAITVTADAKSRAYGDANPALTYQVGGSGLVNGDTLSGALATSATTASNVGLYGIAQGTLAASSNYTLIFIHGRQPHRHAARDHGDGRCQEPGLWRRQSGADLSGRRLGPGQRRYAVGCAGDVGDDSQQCRRLRDRARHARGLGQLRAELYERQPDRHQRAITVTADAKSRAYGDVNPALTYQVGGSGLVNGDTLSGALATSATTASNVGVYGIDPGHARGLGQLRAELCERQPDRHPARDHGDGRCQEPRLWRCQSGADLSGRRLGPGQRRHPVGCAGDVGDDSQQCRRLRHRQGTLAASGNYALNYASANLTVSQRAITVTADAKSRAYGDANPALTYQVGGSGLVNGDTLSGALATSATTVEQCRRLRHRAGHARGLGQLRAELCERQPDRHASARSR